ncbi:hypothetical protein INH39_15960 [Massilia violaceinigra]|uniref:Type VI secretion system amidase effector protein Tae4 n=1 Tax=Massilia violaceinigra TaxID=2045208 RepID=A0ABY4AF18_9BURK|nr:T6SS effector amidase Tae4 family protein [Massilia violaceinigra]UOD32992.1 hypothetical protein INH39_15960 [Massilia violaceinigra]
MKPSFALLYNSYPTKAKMERDVLYEKLGWSDLKNNPAFHNTCAVRVSVALNSAGVPVAGWLKIKDGPLKGKNVEPSQAKLSKWLKRKWGQPEVFRNDKYVMSGVGNRTGVISFWGIDNSAQGHIDLIKPDGQGYHDCALACHFATREIWFWPLL